MNPLSRVMVCLFAIVAIAGCASSTVKERQEYRGGKIARPDHIIVYNFAATPADVPAESPLAGQNLEHSTSQTANQTATGRRLGAQIAAGLVTKIRAMGLPAQQASTKTSPQVGDLVIRGYLISIEEGSTVKRVSIGLGSGASELKAMAEVYLMTDSGLQKLGSGRVDSTGGKAPGGAMGVAALAATGNPAGLIIGTGMKMYGETTGSSKIEGRAEDMATEIANILKVKFKEQGWI
ncbi:uncharacterized protein DUF4410 [Nitrosospira sp. Nsp5]|uniref:Lipoprotein n=1 Tax=Nitrosospira multiformis TaxID=1231 RepID=A0ABY0TK46_9PROT|nr:MULTISPECIES: DUF4410 domain-containing protein [Nitrosospira]PTR10851.1 uncharacterized protein DUF4410 [Nitrosospira sp. Nsp5]SDQ73508.1 protein of unknown function [Nitrosospira multiformis]